MTDALPAHPGTAWAADSACADLLFRPDGTTDPAALGRFFVEAGHVMSESDRRMCQGCTVRRQCLDMSYVGFDGGVMPAGYFAGFSFGQRSGTPYEVLSAQVEHETAQLQAKQPRRSS